MKEIASEGFERELVFFFFFRGSDRSQQADYSVTFGRSALEKSPQNNNNNNKKTKAKKATTTKQNKKAPPPSKKNPNNNKQTTISPVWRPLTRKCRWLWPPQYSGVGCSSLGLFVVGTTVVGIVCGILVVHIGRCGLFLVGLQQAVFK